MSSDEKSWAPSTLPAVIHDTAANLRLWTTLLRNAPATTSPVTPASEAGIERKMEARDREAEALEAGPYYWVTEQMAQDIMDASLDVPAIDYARDVPSPSGVIGLATPLPPLPRDGTDSPIALFERFIASRNAAPVSAVSWWVHDDLVTLQAFIWSGHVSADDYAELAGALYVPLTQIAEATFPATGTQPLAEVHDAPENKALLAFLSAAWVLMAIPAVAEHRKITLEGAVGATAGVTIVDLRPLRQGERVEISSETGQSDQYRWIVRGHWQAQARGLFRRRPRPTWVPSHIEGPEGAPVTTTKRVMTWRR